MTKPQGSKRLKRGRSNRYSCHHSSPIFGGTTGKENAWRETRILVEAAESGYLTDRSDGSHTLAGVCQIRAN